METGASLNMPKGCDSHTNTGWPSQLFFLIDDVTVLHERLKSMGCNVSELRLTKYGLMEFSMQDPDGHMLGFGRDMLDENDQLVEQ